MPGLKGNFYVQWKSFLQIRDEFDLWQTKARDEGENKLFNFRGLNIEMCPTGIKVGEKGTMFFRWRFLVDGVTFMMMNSPTYANSPNMMFDCSGDYCLTADEGALSGYAKALEVVEKLGGTLDRDQIGRADICLDLPDWQFDYFSRAYRDEKYITRVKCHHQEMTTLYFGKNPLRLRIYDKLAEVKQKADPVIHAAMIYRRWGEKEPAAALRIEFQIGGKRLKEYGVSSIASFMNRQAQIVEILMTEWMRFTDRSVDREHKNQTRCRVDARWALMDFILMKIKSEIEVHDLFQLASCMDRVGMVLDSEQSVREFFAAITCVGISILQNEYNCPTSEFIDLMKEFLTNQKGKAA